VDKSLIQTVVKLTSPGVPDLYNGSELWDLSLVDPDNRRAVDYALRSHLLERVDAALRCDRAAAMREMRQHWCDARIKLATVVTLLRHRKHNEELYSAADYQPLQATGERLDDLCAYARTRADKMMIVAAARRRVALTDWRNTTLVIPEHLRRGVCRELLTGRELRFNAESMCPTDLFTDLPVAVAVIEAG